MPDELVHYLPGNMRLHDLTPSEYRAAELVDLHLGRAVQQAYKQGAEQAKAAAKADEAIQQRITQMRNGGRPAPC